MLRNIWYKTLLLTLAISHIMMSLPFLLAAQCPMCKTNLESAMQNEENTVGLGINTAILYLLVMPYIAVMIVGYVWYRNKKKKEQAEHLID